MIIAIRRNVETKSLCRCYTKFEKMKKIKKKIEKIKIKIKIPNSNSTDQQEI